MWWLSVRVQDIVNKFAFRYVIAHAWHQNPPLVNVQMMPCKHTNTIWFRRRQNKSQWKQTVNWMRQKRGFCLSNIPIYRKMWARSSLNCLFLFAHFEYTHGIEMEKRQRRPAERQSGVKKKKHHHSISFTSRIIPLAIEKRTEIRRVKIFSHWLLFSFLFVDVTWFWMIIFFGDPLVRSFARVQCIARRSFKHSRHFSHNSHISIRFIISPVVFPIQYSLCICRATAWHGRRRTYVCVQRTTVRICPSSRGCGAAAQRKDKTIEWRICRWKVLRYQQSVREIFSMNWTFYLQEKRMAGKKNRLALHSSNCYFLRVCSLRYFYGCPEPACLRWKSRENDTRKGELRYCCAMCTYAKQIRWMQLGVLFVHFVVVFVLPQPLRQRPFLYIMCKNTGMHPDHC